MEANGVVVVGGLMSLKKVLLAQDIRAERNEQCHYAEDGLWEVWERV